MWANSTEQVLETERSGCSPLGEGWGEGEGDFPGESHKESEVRRVTDETSVDRFRNDDANG